MSKKILKQISDNYFLTVTEETCASKKNLAFSVCLILHLHQSTYFRHLNRICKRCFAFTCQMVKNRTARDCTRDYMG